MASIWLSWEISKMKRPGAMAGPCRVLKWEAARSLSFTSDVQGTGPHPAAPVAGFRGLQIAGEQVGSYVTAGLLENKTSGDALACRGKQATPAEIFDIVLVGCGGRWS